MNLWVNLHLTTKIKLNQIDKAVNKLSLVEWMNQRRWISKPTLTINLRSLDNLIATLQAQSLVAWTEITFPQTWMNVLAFPTTLKPLQSVHQSPPNESPAKSLQFKIHQTKTLAVELSAAEWILHNNAEIKVWFKRPKTIRMSNIIKIAMLINLELSQVKVQEGTIFQRKVRIIKKKEEVFREVMLFQLTNENSKL